ncbi:hypothetical protein BGX27_003550, partial [Mortierella sp. AM989]
WELFPKKAPVIIDLTTEDISPVQESVLLRIKAIVGFMSQLGLDVEQLGLVEREMIILEKGNEKFINSTNVFIHRTQTLLELDPPVQISKPAPISCYALRAQFDLVRETFKNRRSQDSNQSSGPAENIDSRSCRGGFNRYRTIDRPFMPEIEVTTTLQQFYSDELCL